MTNAEKVIEIFDSGLNCAQAVISIYAEKFKLDHEVALKLTCGFGAGMARMQEMCGAVTGAVMVIGLAVGEQKIDYADRKEKVYAKITEFIKHFKEKNKFIKCSELLKCDINTEEGKYFFDVNELHDNVCMKCVKDAVLILDDLIK